MEGTPERTELSNRSTHAARQAKAMTPNRPDEEIWSDITGRAEAKWSKVQNGTVSVASAFEDAIACDERYGIAPLQIPTVQ